jgi:hypothetical protein
MRERIGETADWGDATPWVGWRSSLLQPPTRSFPDAQDENRKKPRVEAAAGVEAQNAPTPAWKTHRTGFPQLPQALSSGTKVLPMFPVNFVTYLPGCS